MDAWGAPCLMARACEEGRTRPTTMPSPRRSGSKNDMRWLKRLVVGTLSVILVLVALALIVPFLIPTSTYKDQIETRVKAATGRDLKLGGALSLSILPSLELSARDVAFGN